MKLRIINKIAKVGSLRIYEMKCVAQCNARDTETCNEKTTKMK